MPHGFGIGILNVHKRLELAFGHDFTLDFLNQKGFAIVKLTFPFYPGKKKGELL